MELQAMGAGFRAACFAAAAAALAGCGHDAKHVLRMILPPGTAYGLSIRTDEALTAENPDGTESVTQWYTEWRFLLRVDEMYENGDLRVSALVELSTIDPQKFRVGLAVMGSEFSMRVSSRGKIVEWTGTTAMRERARSRLNITEEERASGAAARLEEWLLSTVSDEALAGLIEPLLYIWPPGPVSMGDRWTREPVPRGQAGAMASTEFTLESWDPALAVVSFRSDLTPPEPAGGAERRGTETGEIRIAPVAGVFRSYRATGTARGSMASPDGAQLPVERAYTIHADVVRR